MYDWYPDAMNDALCLLLLVTEDENKPACNACEYSGQEITKPWRSYYAETISASGCFLPFILAPDLKRAFSTKSKVWNKDQPTVI